MVLTSRTSDEVESKASQISALTGGPVIGCAGDVSDPADVDGLVGMVVDTLGRIDVLVNNAGINVRGAMGDLRPDEFEQSLAVNVTGTWLMCRAVEPIFRQAQYGRVINISSTFGLVGAANRTAYAASKGAVVNLTRALALEWAPIGATVNTIAPGPFLTDMNIPFKDTEHAQRVISQEIALKRWGELHEIQGAVLFLASDASSYVTGSVLTVDGGWTAH